MPRSGRRLLRRCVVLAVAVALLSFVPPASTAPAHALPECLAGLNRFGNIAPFAVGSYVTAEIGYTGRYDAMLRAARDDIGPWEEWTICSYMSGATKISYIKNEYNDRYVSAELSYTGADDAMLRARATTVGPWEKFSIERWGPNPTMYTIKSLANGKYVTVELGTSYTGNRRAMLRARGTSIGNWQKFHILCGVPYSCTI